MSYLGEVCHIYCKMCGRVVFIILTDGFRTTCPTCEVEIIVEMDMRYFPIFITPVFRFNKSIQ